MNRTSRMMASSLLAALLCGAAGPSAFASDDADKLKELERAMAAAPDRPTPAKNARTRAIVFDQAGGAAEAPKAPAALDCAALPNDIKVVPVEFAIQFKIGSPEVAPASEAMLREIAKILSLNQERCILVEGHTDASGNAERNLALSQERARSVVKFIVEKAGINPARLVPIGKGSSDPIKNLDSRDQKNRRVVFKIAT